ncbi:hypothetical protein NC652_040916 [Populus alba x Populus x berolinensis]|nr:hypothetical protein NC652_040916 [Populus alba x Populus x berolinensis]
MVKKTKVLRVCVVSTEAWFMTMKWEGIWRFFMTERKIWKVNEELAVFVQKWEEFEPCLGVRRSASYACCHDLILFVMYFRDSTLFIPMTTLLEFLGNGKSEENPRKFIDSKREADNDAKLRC